MGEAVVLQIDSVNKTFGGLHALNNVNLTIEEGKVHAIIGPNGAGKSTLLNVCIGRLDPDSGSVTFAGENIIGKTPYEINQLGIARVFQTPEIFSDLSLLQNVMIPAFSKRDGAFKINAFKALMAEAFFSSQRVATENISFNSYPTQDDFNLS